MSEERRAIFGYFKELGGVLLDLAAGAGSWGAEQATRYLTFLKRTSFVFLILGGVLILALVVGVVTRQDWLISGAGLLIGLATAAILLLATPLGTLAVILGRAVEPVKAFLKVVGAVLLWALLLTLYFSVVPISNNPKAIFLVVLITFIVALFWALYGISPDPKRLYSSVISVFLITTVSFFFPKSFAATLALRGRLDEKLAECLTSPSTCFSRQLPQEGVGSVEPPRPVRVSLEVKSDPEGAEVFVDWALRGRTPVQLEGEKIRGLLVVAKEGRQAGFRSISYRESAVLNLNLPPESTRSRTRLLLLVSEGASGEAFSSLRSRMVEEGFTVLGLEEAKEFQREVSRAGGLSHRGLRAWARARFDTDLVVTARVRQSSRDLSDQELGYLGIREAVKGAVRAEVGIDLEVVDLRSGDHLAAVSGKGSGFALDPTQGFQKALSQAASESAKLLRQRIRG